MLPNCIIQTKILCWINLPPISTWDKQKEAEWPQSPDTLPNGIVPLPVTISKDQQEPEMDHMVIRVPIDRAKLGENPTYEDYLKAYEEYMHENYKIELLSDKVQSEEDIHKAYQNMLSGKRSDTYNKEYLASNRMEYWAG